MLPREDAKGELKGGLVRDEGLGGDVLAPDLLLVDLPGAARSQHQLAGERTNSDVLIRVRRGVRRAFLIDDDHCVRDRLDDVPVYRKAV